MATKVKRKSSATGSSSLTVATVRDRVGDRSFRLGQQYEAKGSVYDCRRQGDVLKARCEGSSAPFYRVEATVKKGRITQADCSCPVGDGGYCKHMAAMLLHWLKQPEEFREAEETRALLAGRSKEELIALIEQMLERQPELDSLLELMLPSGGPETRVDPRAYRKQVAAAFREAGWGWEADDAVTAELGSLKDIGDQFLERGETASAAAVYGGIIEGFVEGYESFEDETGNSAAVVQCCVEQLGRCLEVLDAASPARSPAIEALLELLRFDVDFGGIGMSDEIPEIIARHATPQEQAVFVAAVKKLLNTRVHGSDSWQRSMLGGILLDLRSRELDDESYFRECRELGLTRQLFERLLALGRTDEAVAEIGKLSGYECLTYANLLVDSRQPDLAESLVRELMKSAEHPRHYEDWLIQFYTARKDWKPLLDIQVERFRKSPTARAYEGLRATARKLKRWNAVRADLAPVVISQASSEDRIRICLLEKEVDEAIELLQAMPKKSQSFAFEYGSSQLAAEVAQAAEKTRPEAALGLYLQTAEQRIICRGRANYQSACEYLKKVRELYQRLGREVEWRQCVAGLEQENRALHAFRDELRRAKLL